MNDLVWTLKCHIAYKGSDIGSDIKFENICYSDAIHSMVQTYRDYGLNNEVDLKRSWCELYRHDEKEQTLVHTPFDVISMIFSEGRRMG